MIKAGIIGGAGYTGGELIRILINHPEVTIDFVHSKSNAGNNVAKVHADLLGENLLFSGDEVLPKINVSGEIDVLFLCMGHGDSKKFLDNNSVHDSIKIIDLANDFRLSADAHFKGKEFVYGLPELNREKIKSAKNIANPGCFATAIQLGLLPLANNNSLLGEIFTTGITGSTGAGQKLAETSHFSWRNNNISAYKTLTHQHLGEIYQSINQLQNDFPQYPNQEKNSVEINFVPWRGDFTRGIFISSTLDCDLSLEELQSLYQTYYKDAVFTFFSDKNINLKQIVNTNNCIVSLEKVGKKLVVHSAIDNLLKGASGQAVQNMNLLFSLDEKTGLRLKANYF